MVAPDAFDVRILPVATRSHPRADGAVAWSAGRVATGLYGTNGRFNVTKLGGGFVVNDSMGILLTENTSLIADDNPVEGVQFTSHGLTLLSRHEKIRKDGLGYDHRVYVADLATGEASLVQALPAGSWHHANISDADDFIVYRTHADAGVSSILSFDAGTRQIRWAVEAESITRLDRVGDVLVSYEWRSRKPSVYVVRSTVDGSEVERATIPLIDGFEDTVMTPVSDGDWLIGAQSNDESMWAVFRWNKHSGELIQLWSHLLADIYDQELLQSRAEDREDCGWDLSGVPHVAMTDDRTAVVAVLGGMGESGGACHSACALAYIPLDGSADSRVQIIDTGDGVTLFEPLGGNQWLVGAGSQNFLCTLR